MEETNKESEAISKLGAALQARREWLGISLREMVELIGVGSASSWSRWERGLAMPSAYEAALISGALGLPLPEAMNLTEEIGQAALRVMTQAVKARKP